MAEFKISRFRYTWKGSWNTSTAYIKDDVVRYGGSSWVCVRAHTSSAFQTDQDFLANENDTDFSRAWTKMTDGRAYRGDWAQSTLYNPGDIIKYGGNLYLVVTSYTSSSTFDDALNNISVYSESTNWRGDWTQNTRYGQGDLVRYGGQVYKCFLGHTSSTTADGPEVGNNDTNEDSTLETWSVYYENIEFKGEYDSDNIRYKINDLVLYNGSLLRCVESYTSAEEFDSTKWQLEADGNEFEAEWSDEVYYGQGSVVRYGGYLYYAVIANYNRLPIDSIYQVPPAGIAWRVLSEGINLQGDWSPAVDYKTGDVVRRGGILYQAIIDTQDDGSTLGYLDTSNWIVLNESVNYRGDWAPEISYAKGDTVVFLGSLYKANIAHTSADGLDANTPGDNGSGYVYWDLILQAQTNSGLRNLGDLLTYDLNREQYGDNSSFSVTNLPIGEDGQLLSANDLNSLFYKTYGQIARVFYVTPDGVDDAIDPQRGLSPFKPWRTVRFACEQADDGFSGFTTVRVSTGEFEETLPIIIPARTVVRGDELRSTTIKPAGPVTELADDSTYTISALTRIEGIIADILRGNIVVKTTGNTLTQTVLTELVSVEESFDPPQVNPGTGEEIFNTVIIEQPITVSDDARDEVLALIDDITAYIDFYINSTGTAPTLSGSNTAVTRSGHTNAVLILEANKEFIAAEAVAYVRTQFPAYTFDGELCKRDMRRYVDAWKYDIIYTGNYKSILAARYYRNAVLGSATEDMFYCRDATGVRNCTLKGLNGTLNPPDAFDLYQRPTGGAYTSLDPGWGPADDRTWILTRSPYIQGVTNIGDNCVGVKVDGALHNGGNRSMVANDYTQVLSDGIGAWCTNNGRSELVSVFTYYCTIGYYCNNGGIIRGTNGNCSYGNYGAIADDVDPTEVPTTATVNARNQEAEVFQALAGEFVDEITVLEFINAGQKYTSATASFVGAGVNAEVSFEDFRDNAVFEARLTDILPSATFIGSISETTLTVTSVISGTLSTAYELVGEGINENTQIVAFGTGTGTTGTYVVNQSQTVSSTTMVATTTNLVAQYVGGGGYSIQQNNAQPHSTPNGDLTSITIATNDTALETDYLGKRIILTSGTGTGQYGYITAYNTLTKVVSVSRESDDQPGWDHVIPGRPTANLLDTTTRYRIEPRVIFSKPEYSAEEKTVPVSATWNDIAYGEITQTFTAVAGDAGTGSVVDDDGLSAITATFNVVQNGRVYDVTLNNPGAGYAVGDTIVIEGDDVGGLTPENDITIVVTGTTDDSTNEITTFTFDGFGHSGKFVAVPAGGNQGVYSIDGDTWTAFTLPSEGDWKCIAAGNNRFVAIRTGSDVAASSLNGLTWTPRTMPDSRLWNAVVYGGDKFVAVAADQNSGAYSADGTTWTAMTMPTIGDSTLNIWVDVAYGKGLFVAIANSQNISASSTDGINWEGHIMDVIADSSQRDWVSVAYGNNRFVAISSQGDVAYSFDGTLWYPATMPQQDGSTHHAWYKIRYAQGVFFAVGDTGSRTVGADETTGPSTFAATSPDGVTWTGRTLASELEWRSLAFGNPFITQQDSTLAPNSPMWITASASSDKFNKIRTGAQALGRAYVTSGQIVRITLFDTGSGYRETPTVTVVDPGRTSNANVEARLGDGVLSNPEWINRGLGYRTVSTIVTIAGDGFADSFVTGKNVTLNNLDFYPGPGAQITFAGNLERYVVSAVTELETINGGLSATFRIAPDLQVRDNLEHDIVATIQISYSQVRLTGHDFLDIGTGNFSQTNYPELYATGNYTPEPEAEIYEEDGGRVFYTSTDQSGNFRTGELFAVEQATGIVTISADFFDLAGLTELRLGGIRVGGTGAVIREFSTDALFTADSNNIIPTQRAIKAYLNNRLTVGGSEIATSSFIAGTVRVGPDLVSSTISGTVVFQQRADFDLENSGISGLMIAQSMFFKSFASD